MTLAEKFYKNRNWLENAYIRDLMTVKEIAKLYLVNTDTIYRWLKIHCIKLRAYGLSNSGCFKKGDRHPFWKGGRTTSGKKGYIVIRVQNHPNATPKGYVMEHRLIAEKALGRHLKQNEMVHHNNGNVKDNRNRNFIVCSRSYHQWLERKMSDLYKKEHFGSLL